jgi:hypothetical protein
VSHSSPLSGSTTFIRRPTGVKPSGDAKAAKSEEVRPVSGLLDRRSHEHYVCFVVAPTVAAFIRKNRPARLLALDAPSIPEPAFHAGETGAAPSIGGGGASSAKTKQRPSHPSRGLRDGRMTKGA